MNTTHRASSKMVRRVSILVAFALTALAGVASAQQPPKSARACASEGGTCSVPRVYGAGDQIVTVYYGEGDKWVSRRYSYNRKTGPAPVVKCTNAAFGKDPIFGTVKRCVYQ